MSSEREVRAGTGAISAEEQDEREEGRRSFLKMGASAALLAGLSSRLQAQTSTPTIATSALSASDAELFFLVDRITNGWTPEVWLHAVAIGYDAFLEEQLAYTTIADSALDALLVAYPTLTLTSKQIYDQYVVPGQTSVPVTDLKTAAVLRAAYSKRQLYERMVEFWSDHFSVDHADNQVQWLKTADDRDVIRVHALGNFKDLLIANAKSAAMLYYLDNYRNFSTAPNENYGREVMELHTMGVGHYTENDVREVARCLTGWQFYGTSDPNHGVFRFNAAQHDNGTKQVLGNTITSNGVLEGEAVFTIFAAQVSTAQFITRKLCRWLLSYSPPQLVLDNAAREYLRTNGDIKAIVRYILSRDVVKLVSPAALPKIKRPFHLVASMLRATNPTMTQAYRLTTELRTMGHQPFAWPAPNGFPETAEVWGSSLLPRWNFCSRFFSGSISGLTVDVATFFSGVPKSGLAAHASRLLTGGRMTPEDLLAVQSYANSVTTLNDTLRRDVLALACSTPSFQVY